MIRRRPKPAPYISVCALLGACGSQVPQGAATPTPAPTHTSPTSTLATDASPGADSSCQLLLHTSIERAGAGPFELVVRAENRADTSLSLLLHTRCPGGPAVFRGLPEGYDYGGTCRQGACASGPTAREALTLAAGTAFELTRVAIAPEGDSCNAALPNGRYVVSASVDIEGARVCGGSEAVLTVAGQNAPEPPAPTQPQKEQEQKQKQKPCPAMACAYVPCPPGVAPPTGCARVCGCAGMRGTNPLVAPNP